MRPTRLLWIVLAALGAAAAPLDAAAQVFTPTFMAPRPEQSVGIYLSDLGELAVEGGLRGNFGGFDLGARVGLVDTDDASLTLGGELRNPLALGTAPIDLAFTAGVQGVLGDVDWFGLQAGLSLGHTFVPQGGGFTLTPYLHPRVALIDFGNEDGMDLELLADFGLNFDFSQRLSLRFGVNLGDGADWGVGLAWR